MSSEYKKLLVDEAATLEFGKNLAHATFENPDSSPVSADMPGAPTIGAIIHLHGDLGAGKTTLTRGIMRGYGYEGAVKSPTYTLVEPYDFQQCHIYHFDLYRLADAQEMDFLGTDDYFQDGNLCIIEWADKGGEHIPAPDLVIRLAGTGTERDLVCQTLSEKGEIIAKRLWQTGRNL